LHQALKSGKNLCWKKVELTKGSIQPRLKHGCLNYDDQLNIFGGASANLESSGLYNDLWNYDNHHKYQRVKTNSSSCPAPKANFGFVNAGSKMLVVGGKKSVGSGFSRFPMEQNYSTLSSFELHSLNPVNGTWQKVQVHGEEPQFAHGIRCIMLSENELITVSGLIPILNNIETMNIEDQQSYRACMQVNLLKFTSQELDKGSWFCLTEIQNGRNSRNVPLPRIESHLVNLGNDCILLFGGRAVSSCCQDAWIMKITRSPSNYLLHWHQVTIENPLSPSLPTHIFPSCVINDLLVFVGVRKSLMKNPEIEKPRSNNNSNNNNNANNNYNNNNHHDGSSSSSSNSVNESPRSLQPQNQQQSSFWQQAEARRIFINQERPMNTIGTMAAFSVLSSAVPQKLQRIQISPEPQPIVQRPPTPKRLSQVKDYKMLVFCLDLSNIMDCTDEALNRQLTIKWIPMKNDGLYPFAPELRLHASFTQLDNGIVLFGGIKRNHNDDDDVTFTQSTNETFILSYCNDDA
jgi:hypothetical protein